MSDFIITTDNAADLYFGYYEDHPTTRLPMPFSVAGKEYEFEEDAAWYKGAVKWAKDSELIYENDKDFDPESAISRQQLASVLYLYAQFKGYDVSVGEETNILSYDDAFDISEYAIPAMQYVIGAGIINGKTSSTVNPEDNATRAEIAVILHRFIEKTKEI